VLDISVRRPVAPADVAALRDVAALAAAAAGHPVLGDSVWRDLAHPSPDTTLVVAQDHGVAVGVLHAGRNEAGASSHLRLSVAVAPGQPVGEVAGALVRRALDDLRDGSGHLVELWVSGADDDSDAVAAELGLKPARDLWQLRVRLPVPSPRWPPGVTVRPFEPGRDDDAWLRVNNRAFAADPDQGRWSLAVLREREREPWFDPAGFLLAFDDRGLAGFCWTRLHPPAPPVEPDALGEIYVIGVDPDRQGLGLGRSLVLAGLDDLHRRRGAAIGMLFVDAANAPALALYQSLGFSLARVDRGYVCDR
jgi:mycothiol synthase